MKTIVIILLLSLNTFSFCQNSNNSNNSTFIEFVVDGETSVELIRKINQDFLANPEFQITRLDIPTERFFAVYKSGIELDLKWFKEQFESYGLTIHCVNTGFVGEKEYQHLAKKDCPEISNK